MSESKSKLDTFLTEIEAADRARTQVEVCIQLEECEPTMWLDKAREVEPTIQDLNYLDISANRISTLTAMVREAKETLAEVIRNSPDIIAKKKCSETLARLEQMAEKERGEK